MNFYIDSIKENIGSIIYLLKENYMNKINPFLEKEAISVEKFSSVDDYSPKPYDKMTTSPYTKTRIILMN